MGKACGEAGDAQDAQRIFAKGVRDMAQYSLFDIPLAVVRVKQFPFGTFGNGVEGQVAAHQILFEGDVRRGIAGKTVVTGAGMDSGVAPTTTQSCSVTGRFNKLSRTAPPTR